MIQARPPSAAAWAPLEGARARADIDFGAFSRDSTDSDAPSADPSPSSWAPAALARARASQPPGVGSGPFGKATLMVVTPWIVRPLARPAQGWRSDSASRRALVAAAALFAVATATGLVWAAGLLPG